MVRRCSGYTPWRLQRACAQVARTPFSTSLFSPPAPGPSLFLSSSVQLPVSFSISVPRVSLSRVCAHTPRSDLHSVRPPCPTLLFAGSRPRESSYVVSSCRVASPRWRTFADAPRFLRLFSGGDTGRRLGRKCKRKKNGKLMHPIERDVNEET